MAKVIGIGETILDILFRGSTTATAVPGGSVFNSIVSLGRAGIPVSMVTEVGNDPVGELILQFMEQNNVQTESVNRFRTGKSPVSLAFLNQQNEATYSFYRDYPSDRLNVKIPAISADDVVIFGSYYAINPDLHERVAEILQAAKRVGALIYYDVNFRSSHKSEAIHLMPIILENLGYADIIRGSEEDFMNLFGMDDAKAIFQDKIAYYSPYFICTRGGKDISLFVHQQELNYSPQSIQTVSTVGAGDNFNAGFIFELMRNNISKKQLATLSVAQWDALVRTGMEFSAEVCTSWENVVSHEFVKRYK